MRARGRVCACMCVCVPGGFKAIWGGQFPSPHHHHLPSSPTPGTGEEDEVAQAGENFEMGAGWAFPASFGKGRLQNGKGEDG